MDSLVKRGARVSPWRVQVPIRRTHRFERCRGLLSDPLILSVRAPEEGRTLRNCHQTVTISVRCDRQHYRLHSVLSVEATRDIQRAEFGETNRVHSGETPNSNTRLPLGVHDEVLAPVAGDARR